MGSRLASSPKITSTLKVHGLRLMVRLGCTEEERRIAQPVEWNLEMSWNNLPIASESDDLRDTICYDELTKIIASVCQAGDYKLIEHLAYKALQNMRPQLKSLARVFVAVRKLHPPISIPNDGTSFEIEEVS